jgi:hypothetical protein
MVGIPEISGPQERERNVENNPQKERLHYCGSTVPSGEPSSGDESELRPSTRVFKEMRERPQLSMQGGVTEGEQTLREDWPVVNGGWRHTGVEELPCELVRVALSRIGGPSKAAQIPEESQESKFSAGNSTRSWVSAPNVRKNATQRKLTRKLTSKGRV